MTDLTNTMFERIYATDLVYARECWKLCGGAHCCSFGQYKSKFRMIGHQHFQELPLLPGEHEFLAAKGWLSRFRPFEHRVVEYPLDAGTMRIETMVGRSQSCLCEHDSRTVTCRLYPLLPVFDIEGRLVGIDNKFGIFEEIEELNGMQRACKVDGLSFDELNKFLAIASAIGSNPVAVFYITAYRMAKAHAQSQLARAKAARPMDAFSLFEGMFLTRRLLDQAVLRPQLNVLAARFREHYGSRFSLA